MTIHLIRHGPTQANAEKRYCGRTDPPLSEKGAAQLKALKAQGVYPAAQAFFTSGMQRCCETLALLYGDVEGASIPELAEYDFGAFEMRTYEELRHDPAYIAWIVDETGETACPGGESKRQCQKRTLDGFQLLLARLEAMGNPGAAAIVHGGTIVTIMSHLFPGERNFYEWQPPPGLGYTLNTTTEGEYIYQPIEGERHP